jgi:hypothetical protein
MTRESHPADWSGGTTITIKEGGTMRLPGYCEKCRKIKQVRVGNAGMVQLAMNKPVFGICASCEEAEREAARARHPSRRGRV